MSLPRVYITRKIPTAALDLLQGHIQMEMWDGDAPIPYDVLIQKTKGKDGLYSMLSDRIDSGLMDAGLPTLKVISQMAVGYDNIDILAAVQRRLPVGNTPGVLTDTTADFAWTLLMAAARRLTEAERYVRRGDWKVWSPSLLLGQDVAGATLGIVGFGRIGQAVARRAHGFDMRILYYDPQRQPQAEKETGAIYVPFDELLAQADFVSIHTWLSKETYHLFGIEQFRRMKPTAALINTSRGGTVDPAALYTALKEGLIAYAGLDVTEPEPIPADSPLLTLENLVIAPHISSASVKTRTRMAVMAAENLLAGLRGERLPNCANPQVYE